jgi:cholesterol transport system auxiliary component
MNRRLFLATPLLLSACGLAERPYAQRRDWPLLVPRPTILPAPTHGPILEMRALAAGPGMEQRGLQTIQPDGSIRTAFYDEWSTPPAEATQSALRLWLADSGLFSAVITQGSRLTADLSLEGELNALWTTPTHAHAALNIVLIDRRPASARVVVQQDMTADVPLGDKTVPGSVKAQIAALSQVFQQIEDAVK